MTASTKRTRTLTAALICAALALVWTTANYSALRLAWETRRWPMVPGTLLIDFKKRLPARPGKLFAYHYVVGTRNFTGSNYDTFGGCRDKDMINLLDRLLMSRMATGVEVYYSPKNPSTAVMVPGFRTRHILILASCVLLWGLAIQFARDAIRQSRAIRARRVIMS
jgi:hypothetical protein